MSKSLVWCRTVGPLIDMVIDNFHIFVVFQMFAILCIGVKKSPAAKSKKTLSDKGKIPATRSEQKMKKGD